MNKSIVKWDIDLDDSISAIGLIVEDEQPAIQVGVVFSQSEEVKLTEEDQMFFNVFQDEQEEEYQLQEASEEALKTLRDERIVLGPALIPNKLILRLDDDGDPFYGYFPPQAVRNAAYSFQKYKLQDNFNINHNQDEFVDGVFIAETWIIEDPANDKAAVYGYSSDKFKGTWMISLKFENDELYDKFVASGEVNGFSIETLLTERVILSGAGHLNTNQSDALDVSQTN